MARQFFGHESVLIAGPRPSRAENQDGKPRWRASDRDPREGVKFHQAEMPVLDRRRGSGTVVLSASGLIGGIPNLDHQLTTVPVAVSLHFRACAIDEAPSGRTDDKRPRWRWEFK